MSQKYVWALPPKIFQSRNGTRQVVGYKTIYDTGKSYPTHGKRAREKAEKRKKRKYDEKQVE